LGELSTTLLAYLLLAIFFASEGRVRGAENARRMDPTRADRGSTRLVGAVFGVLVTSVLAAPLLNRQGRGQLRPHALGWLGVLMMSGGLALRTWANRALGGSYTRTLQTTSEQQIVESGPYRWIRHPGYTGSILLYLGAGLATLNLYGLVAIALSTLTAYAYRIRAEETMLLAAFGESYRGYMARTRRLLPFLF
jgi:protein-S-isoprenylcysteine O-methyltransferase Ste14